MSDPPRTLPCMASIGEPIREVEYAPVEEPVPSEPEEASAPVEPDAEPVPA